MPREVEGAERLLQPPQLGGQLERHGRVVRPEARGEHAHAQLAVRAARTVTAAARGARALLEGGVELGAELHVAEHALELVGEARAALRLEL